ncbi:MAG TPA: hypothetical protein VES42_03590 [Pilimelia sp.]|nr:hypothetical protein [Pilimelia sp.]
MGDVGAALTDMWRSVLLFLPKAVAFAVIIGVGWLVATAVRKVVHGALERVGFDRAVQRGGVGRALARGRYDASDILARLAYYGLLLLTLQVGFGVWGDNPVSDLISGVVRWLPRAFVAIIIVVVATAIGTAVKDLIAGALGGLSYGRLLANIAAWFIIGLGAIAALDQVGIATAVTTPVLIAVLATVSGVLIVGVGGGLVRPMAQRWDRWLEHAETESRVIRDRARAYQAARADMAQATAGGATAGGATADGAAADGATAGAADETQVIRIAGAAADDAAATQPVRRVPTQAVPRDPEDVGLGGLGLGGPSAGGAGFGGPGTGAGRAEELDPGAAPPSDETQRIQPREFPGR